MQDARQQMQRQPFDLLVLDVGLPDGCGLDLLRDVRHGQAAAALRLRQATPVLMLSARGEELDRVLGKTGINVMTRLMGLILAALAVEVMADGLGKLFPVLVAR